MSYSSLNGLTFSEKDKVSVSHLDDDKDPSDQVSFVKLVIY